MTNLIGLRTVSQFMSDYNPAYQPFYPLLLSGKTQQYEPKVGIYDFKRINTIGDIRARRITPKDTEIKQIAVSDSKKSFSSYFFANQYTVSSLQDQQGTEEVVAQVLDEHQKQMDEIFF